MIVSVLFRPDENRIKEVGPDRACAEWLLRCGAHLRWQNSDKFHTDYNTLPGSNYGIYKVEEINADEAAVMDIGFPHFGRMKCCFYNLFPVFKHFSIGANDIHSCHFWSCDYELIRGSNWVHFGLVIFLPS